MRDRNLLFFDRKRCILMGLSVTLSFAPFLQAKAQLIPDNTLGKEKSIVNSSELLQRIDGGAIRGSNLFHSFKEFNIDSGKSVYFNNPGAIENILTRVTGKNPSNIFGKLGVLGNANLFLLNPNGIVFGKGASLDIPGSFNASTSPGILFDNSFEFSATNPSSVPLLKVNLTPGLQYPRSQQGDISNQGSLTVGKDLNFLGKNIDLNGSLNSGRDLTLKASDTLQIRDNLNNPFIVNAGRDLLLQANQTIDIFALNHSDSGLFSGNDLILQSANPVFGDARYFSGGNFRIEKLDGNLGDLESPKDPIIRASGDVSFDSYRGASLHILAGGSVDITGNVTITGADGENGLQETVTLSNGENLEIDGKNQATLDIRAGTTVSGTKGITGSGNLTPRNPNTGGSGSSSNIFIGGDIRFDGGDGDNGFDDVDGLVFLTNQYFPNTNLIGGNIEPKGILMSQGSIIIDAINDIKFNEVESIFGFSYSPYIELEKGNITFISSQGSVLAPEFDFSSTDNGFNDSPDNDNYIPNSNRVDLAVTAKGNIDIFFIDRQLPPPDSMGKITLNSTSGDIYIGKVRIYESGKTGDINITTGGSINIDSNLDLLSDSSNSSIVLTAGENIITSDIEFDAYKSNTEAIKMTAGNNISTGSLITYSDEGNGGTVKLEANNNINVDSIITSGAKESGDIYLTSLVGNLNLTDNFISSNAIDNGNSGNIYLQAPQIELKNTDITSTVPGTGKSGSIFLNSSNLINLDNSRLLTAVEPNSRAVKSGNIEINAPKLNLENFSLIDTGTYSNGDAGNVDISAQEIYLNNDSNIFSLTHSSGNAGNINLQADSISLTNRSKIATAATSSSRGDSGNIDIISNSLFLSKGSQLLALTQGLGSSGNIDINIGDEVDITGIGNDGSLSGIFTSSEGIDSDRGGDINIKTGSLNIADGGVLSAETFSKSDGGDITVNADSVSLLSGGQMLTNTYGAGKAGVINIDATNSINIAGSDSEFDNRLKPIEPEEQDFPAFYNCSNSFDCETLPEQGPNNSIETAQKIIDENFALNNNSNVEFSNRIPYVSIGGEIKDNVDYYAIEIKQPGTRAIIDLDSRTIGLNTKLTVFNKKSNELASNENSSDYLGAGGSLSISSSQDPYIRYTFTKPDTYLVQVSKDSASKIDGNYHLQISLETPSLTASTVNSGAASGIFARTEGAGTAGNVEINTPLFNIADGAKLTVSSKGNSSAGNLLVDAKIVNINNQAKIAAETKSGISGNVQFNNLESLQLARNSLITASTVDGEAGDIIINASDLINIFDASGITSEAKGEGIAGELNITTGKFNIINASRASVNSKKAAGDLTVTADSIILDNQARLTSETADGISGDIKLQDLKTLQLSRDSLISATTKDGEAGDITINAEDSVKIETDSKIASGAVGGGIAGFIEITTDNLTISDNSQATVSSKSSGDAGYILIEASNINLDNRAKISATTKNGISGNITLKDLNSLTLSNHADISASTVDGEAGDISIIASDEVKLGSHSKLESAATVKGEAGFIEITTNNLTISDNSQTTVSSKGSGNAGYILIEASNINLDNRGKISATTKNGISGNITLKDLNSLTLSNHADISASTVDGEAGDISINASDEVKLGSHSKLESAATGKGEAGFIEITTNNLTISDNSQTTVSSKGSGDAGYILIEASDINLDNQAKIFANTQSGISGNITLKDLNSLFLRNSEISASTVDGEAGNLNINAADSIEITGKGGLSVQANKDGIAGSITVNTSDFSINNQAKITVSSKLGQAGNLDIIANKLSLDRGTLTAETSKGESLEGANITLSVNDLLIMSNNSLISAEAFDTANGGNITINNEQGFTIGLPFENSDITANANQGDGGDIDITTQNIIGLVFREQKTPKSDITASSKFGVNGEVTVNQLNENPATALVELPKAFVEKDGIKAGCAASNGNNFIVSGKGGLPQNPGNLFNGETTLTDLFDLVATKESSTNISNENSNINVKNKIVEATGWVVDNEGNVIFVAQMPEDKSQDSVIPSVDCESF